MTAAELETASETAGETAGETETAAVRRPLYPRLLRLRHVHPNGWQRALLGEGAIAFAALLVLADLATSWTLLVLPLAVAGVVKAHDLLAGLLSADDLRHPAESHAEVHDHLGPEDVDRS
ncbi:MAG: Collagen alpha-5(VI) chain [Frankiales bacterium]|jgi:hypothetical protein|nr:Collagen alpha-5(VI) chain [Frankiales bacterium]